ncbi:methionine aminopeptidase [Buchnera aphidicola str. Bp (Baizongia pistaciae)]|uniref:Methionine aminopeptidase n=1 Tax=Buchnera aphidicola subsp. Baizongia pistaciae (strain Bp) TaxID=224915 RepID=MAP1_BUCBP|nr:type I methionyl aminopeptidase [Buchnera aphidicola]Q89AP3.1 RecName: Full=Methionine aminopeptidase; Short=MAP; Short=MetAP; AltName: Full=Peptidase M [Buchnera aphidicola str. Bp (Baizongia pistaciae)]AAO26944.1 methionine aminopeptidase [Buchnera aphidicola str. Bp (Baizongia pistaciae)]
MTCIFIKNINEINKMRLVGKLVADVLDMIKEYIVPGITTEELNNICHNYITYKQHAKPACLGYQGFPKSICTSINDIVCHGIPNKNSILKNGDIINIDVAILKDKYYSDASKMFFVGKPTELGKKLCYVAKKSLYLALYTIRPGINLQKLGKVIQNYVKKQNFSIVKEYCGHGIGRSFHEPPQILHHNYYKSNTTILQSGMTFTVEPMINSGSCEVQCTNDGWTVKTKDKSLSAQYEHTILVNEEGCEILTLQKGEQISRILKNLT